VAATLARMPNDHSVPQMYLRRFAVQRRKNWYTHAANVETPEDFWETNVRNVASQTNFYTFEDIDGEAHRDLENFFTSLEGMATPAMRTILDDPRWALTEQWPLEPEHRGRLAWFMAAQIVRTTRQRKRLAALIDGPKLDLPGQMRTSDIANEHARFIVSAIAVIAFTLHARPWGLGHSSMCLMASDCPVVILNEHDADDQITAAARSDIAFPLDPHRLLFLPDLNMAEDDPEKRQDHRMALQGLGSAVAQMVYDAADRQVYAHPDHKSFLALDPKSRLPMPGEEDRGHGYVMDYQVLAPGFTIERRYAHEHVPARSKRSTD
jgi:hypothetical protein